MGDGGGGVGTRGGREWMPEGPDEQTEQSAGKQSTALTES